MKKGQDRRSFLRSAAGIGLISAHGEANVLPSRPPRLPANPRCRTSLEMRESTAALDMWEPMPDQANNGDETGLPGFTGSFTKGLPHDQMGVVEPAAYGTLLHAISTGQHSDFENIDRGSGMKLVNPQSAYTWELEGLDSHQLACPPAPAVGSAQGAAEMVELYWQALARDIPFGDYASSPIIQTAGQELARLSGFQGPGQGTGNVTPDLIFRGPFAGCLVGPYISQFLWKPVPTLSTWLDQRYRVPVPGTGYLVNYDEWLLIQSGLPPYRTPVFDTTTRYIYTARGLAEWVHYDFLYQAFHNAALILLNQAPETILDTNAYYSRTNPYKNSKIQTGFATFGAPHVCSWLGRITTAALQAAWYQKWAVHRRLRPEEFGGLVHLTATRASRYPISSDLMNSVALSAVFKANGTYLLPQAFPEGCPLHPAYPAGHATVSGACSALLKAFFDENAIVTSCVLPNSDGTALLPYEGPALTVGGELNKLAFNIAMGRNFAGIHYRTDAMAGFQLGEDIAIAKLQDLVNILTEDFMGFQFTRLDGTPVTISKRNI
jgi:hypothetical protein